VHLSSPQEAALGRLKTELSEARLTPYLSAASGDLSLALARYYWNVELCRVFYPMLHALEIAFRNSLDRAIVVNFPVRAYDHIPSWIDRQPRVAIHPGAEGQIQRAKEKLLQRDAYTGGLVKDHRRVHGDLVASMSFGFWAGLLERAYEHPGIRGVWLWPDHARTVFPAAGGEPMPALRSAFNQIRHFRNRVFHHEPVWPKRPSEPSPKERYDAILTALRWLAPEQASLTARVHSVPTIFDSQVQIPLMRTRLIDSIEQALEIARLRKEEKAAQERKRKATDA
jgi:hypothetical protein